MATTQLGRIATTSPWGTSSEIVVMQNDDKDCADRATVAVYTGGASLHMHLTADQCRELCALLMVATVNMTRRTETEAA